MGKKGYLVISGIIFLVVAIFHLIRVLFHIPVLINTWEAPFWISWVGFFVTAILCIWAFRLSTK
jgi:hypothetical protein